MNGINRMIAKRAGQLKRGYNAEHDIKFNPDEQLTRIAACLMTPDNVKEDAEYYWDIAELKNWNKDLFIEYMNRPYIERLVLAGSFLAAQIDIEILKNKS